jgi:hypothetical protein
MNETDERISERTLYTICRMNALSLNEKPLESTAATAVFVDGKTEF